MPVTTERIDGRVTWTPIRAAHRVQRLTPARTETLDDQPHTLRGPVP